MKVDYFKLEKFSKIKKKILLNMKTIPTILKFVEIF